MSAGLSSRVLFCVQVAKKRVWTSARSEGWCCSSQCFRLKHFFHLSLSALSVTSWLEDLHAAKMRLSCCWSAARHLIMQPEAAIMPCLHSVILQAVDRWMVVYPPPSRQEGKLDFLSQQPGTFMVKEDLMHCDTEGSAFAWLTIFGYLVLGYLLLLLL